MTRCSFIRNFEFLRPIGGKWFGQFGPSAWRRMQIRARSISINNGGFEIGLIARRSGRRD
jgi:hypothetical protein